jgi:hypothetical protein
LLFSVDECEEKAGMGSSFTFPLLGWLLCSLPHQAAPLGRASCVTAKYGVLWACCGRYVRKGTDAGVVPGNAVAAWLAPSLAVGRQMPMAGMHMTNQRMRHISKCK